MPAMIRSFQWDLARQVERLDWLLAQLPRYAEWGYQELHLHLEDAVEYPSLPGVARRDAYSYKQFSRLVDAASRVGIKVVPIVNLLGHTQYLIKVPELRDLNELRAADGSPLERGQICPLHPRTLEVAEKLLRDMAPFCTAGKVHVGLDESFHLGKHPLSRTEVASIGLAAHFAGYVQRLRSLTASLGLRMGMWADMLYFIPEAIPLLPRDLVAYDWFYFPFHRLPRIEMFNFKDYDLATPLQARGIEYWGCPMNGSFRYEPLPIFRDRLGNIRSWWERCTKVKAAGMLVTSWEPDRLAQEMTTLVDAAAASLWLNQTRDDVGMLTNGFERLFSASRKTARSWASSMLRCDDYPFAGYARWETHEHWDATSAREDLSGYAKGQQFYQRLEPQGMPEACTSSAAFLKYLYARDVFLREAARGVGELRRTHASGANITRLITRLLTHAAIFDKNLKLGDKAAQKMWLRTRGRRTRGPNSRILAMDARRLKAWRRWLDQCVHAPQIVMGPSVVMGTWQLQFVVHNFAPALQNVIVEQRQPDSTWKMVRSRFVIEFNSHAAAPRSHIKREFSVPIEPVDTSTPALRLAIRGLGQIEISNVILTNGLVERRPHDWPRRTRKTIGEPAPKKGLPDLDWQTNAGAIVLELG